ncbi:MAG TPA: nucleotide disphospho-sugar-binding domain-containing protein [Burkholderiaceae bacterium]|nr:nucleotide disphospho-sugar-binding domain-containing protein [Burkholderiaceae bacterium]
MARFLLTWELGGNLGHAAHLRRLAAEFKRHGHDLVFAVKDLAGVRSLLGSDFGPTLQAPLFLHAAGAQSWTLADVLQDCGYRTTETLASLAEAWKALIQMSGCDVVIADHSPTALLGARLAGKAAVNVGHGFFVPPDQVPLPVFRDWVPVAASHAEESDARTLRNVNQVLELHSAAPLQRLSQLFHPERTVVSTWPETDIYAASSRPAGVYYGPGLASLGGQKPAWPDCGGPRVFAYMRAAWPDHVQILNALDVLGCATLCYMPDRQQGIDPVASSRISYAAGLVDVEQALCGCALVINHSGHGTVWQALRGGIPQLLLPAQTEQFLLARTVERNGAGINAVGRRAPVNYRDLIGELVQPNNRYAAAARTLADKYREFHPSHAARAVVSAAEELAGRR